MDKKTALCAYLKKYHTGKRNAVFSRELERLFSLDGRGVRKKISGLRREGHPICSDESGYYYAENQQEVNATICRLNHQITMLSNARTGMLYASILCSEPASVSINIKIE